MQAPVIAGSCLTARSERGSKRSQPPIHRLRLTSRPITASLAKQTTNYWLFNRAFLLSLRPLFLILVFFFSSPFPVRPKRKKEKRKTNNKKKANTKTPSANTWYSSESCSCTVLLNCYHLFHKQFWQLTSWSYTSKETTVEFNLLELPWIPLRFFFKHFHPEQKCRLIRFMFVFLFCPFIKMTNIPTASRCSCSSKPALSTHTAVASALLQKHRLLESSTWYVSLQISQVFLNTPTGSGNTTQAEFMLKTNDAVRSTSICTTPFLLRGQLHTWEKLNILHLHRAADLSNCYSVLVQARLTFPSV